MKKILTLAIITMTLLSTACTKDDNGTNDAPFAVQIDPTIPDPNLFPNVPTRVSDTDFDTGDKIGVSITMEADNSPFLANKEFSFDGTNFTAPGTLWYEDTNLSSSIFAYYPYQAGTTPVEFSVKTDQTGENYQASDLVVGAKSGVKPEKVINLAFQHKMTRLIIRVTNGSGSDLSEIRIGGAIGTGTIDAKTGNFTAKSGAETVEVKACERTKNELYYALLVPQDGVQLVTKFTTADGKTRSYTLGTTDLVSGTNRELTMNIQPADMQVKLSGPIAGWEDGDDLEIGSGGKVETPTVEWKGVKYKIVTLKDGRTWMAENLRYVPEGKTPSSDPAADAGIWYPAANAEKTADPALVEKLGLLYDASTAFGVEVTPENAMSLEGTQGICPDGWHIPTNAELTGLVGQNSNGALTNPDAPYFDSNIRGASIPVLNEAGFNWCSAGIRNKANLTAAGSYTITAYDGIYGVLSYVWGSTCYQVQYDKATGQTLQNIQYYSFMSTVNATNNKVTVAYGNYKSGYSVRCIKNEE